MHHARSVRRLRSATLLVAVGALAACQGDTSLFYGEPGASKHDGGDSDGGGDSLDLSVNSMTDGPTTGSDDGGCGLATCASVGATCGLIGDGCGGILNCGSCTSPQSCGAGGALFQCGGSASCVPRTCASVGADCGPVADG